MVVLAEQAALFDKDLGKEVLMSLKSEAFPWVIANKVLMAYYMWTLTRKSPKEAQSILKESLSYY